MIPFAEIFTKRSGGPFDISFSDEKPKPKKHMNPPPIPSKPPPLFANNFVFEPMPNAENPISLLENLLAVLICLPSLYIFTCLGGIDAQLRSVCGALCAAVCLSSVLLIGFAPVAWIFSQSTDSIAFMGALHLLFWVIGIRFGLRLTDATGRFLGARGKGHLRIWSFIFILVCFQMTTTLRPIIAPSKTFLPTEKKFFLSHWFDSINAPNQAKK